MFQSGVFMFKQTLLLSVLCASIGLNADRVTWNQVPEGEVLLMSDARWHQLSSKEKDIMLQIVNNHINPAMQSLKDDVVAYNHLVSLYDLLGLAVKSYHQTFIFFLFSQGISLTDESIKSLLDNSYSYLTMAFEFGLSINHRFASGDSLLHYAVHQKRWSIVASLVKAGVDTSFIDGNGKTAFEYVTIDDMDWEFYCYHVAAFGWSPNHRLASGDSLLHCAVHQKQWDSVVLLLKAGADASVVDGKGKTAFEYITYDDMDCWYFRNNAHVLSQYLTLAQRAYLTSTPSILNRDNIAAVIALGIMGLVVYSAYTNIK